MARRLSVNLKQSFVDHVVKATLEGDMDIANKALSALQAFTNLQRTPGDSGQPGFGRGWGFGDPYDTSGYGKANPAKRIPNVGDLPTSFEEDENNDRDKEAMDDDDEDYTLANYDEEIITFDDEDDEDYEEDDEYEDDEYEEDEYEDDDEYIEDDEELLAFSDDEDDEEFENQILAGTLGVEEEIQLDEDGDEEESLVEDDYEDALEEDAVFSPEDFEMEVVFASLLEKVENKVGTSEAEKFASWFGMPYQSNKSAEAEEDLEIETEPEKKPRNKKEVIRVWQEDLIPDITPIIKRVLKHISVQYSLPYSTLTKALRGQDSPIADMLADALDGIPEEN